MEKRFVFKSDLQRIVKTIRTFAGGLLNNDISMTFLRCSEFVTSRMSVARIFVFLIVVSCFAYDGYSQKLPAEEVDAGIWNEGKSIYRSNCGACHKPDSDVPGPGPALYLSTERWDALGEYNGVSGQEWLYRWIKNWKDPVDAGLPYAIEMADFHASQMQLFPAITDGEIEKILYYADNYDWVDPSIQVAVEEAPTGESASDFPINTFLVILVVVLGIIVLVMVRVSSVLNRISKQKAGQPLPEEIPFWRNKKLYTLLGILMVVSLAYITVDRAVALGRQQGYQPEQPIKYSHALHAGVYGIDCQYCHSGASESKHSNIPSANVCMNCHKNIQVGPSHGRQEIGKIYASIGYNPNTGNFIEGYQEMSDESVRAIFEEYLSKDYEEDTKGMEEELDSVMAMAKKPIEWVRVHNLPDHVYFNHAQHVNAGDVECQTCHGAIEEMEVVQQHAPLSMGWCINCHRNTEVDFTGNGYYEIYEKYHEELQSGEIDKITVEDIGGTECQKCHY